MPEIKKQIKVIRRKNKMYIAFMDGFNLMAQARSRALAKLQFELGIFNIKN